MPCVRAFRRAGRRPQVERPARVHDPAADRVSDRVVDGQRFSRQRALVEDGGVGLEASVDGDDLTGLDEQQVTACDVIDGWRSERTVLVAVHHAGRVRQERVQFMLGAGRGACFEGAAARQHDRDDGARQVLADNQCADECEDGERVDTQSTVPGRVDHPPGGRHDPDERVGRPHCVGCGVEIGQIQPATDRQQCDRDGQEHRFELATHAHSDPVHSDRSRTMVATLMRRRPRQVLHWATTAAAKTERQTSATVEVWMRSSQRYPRFS